MKIIKKELVIDAPPAKVWKHLTDPAKIAGWFMATDFDPVVGKAFTMECPTENVSGVVKEVIPHQKLVYTFRSDTTRIDTLVTITLVPEGTGTRLTLIHSGWDALPPADQGITDQFENGWGKFLGNLQKQLEAASR